MDFETENLQSEIENIRSYCDENNIEIAYMGYSIFDEDNVLPLVAEEAKFDILLPGEAIPVTYELNKIINLIDEAKNGEFLNEYTFFNVSTSYIRIDVSHKNIVILQLNSEANF
ncbi:hypothetical protein, partial [Paenibacillus nuruki]|uniref:hypothetical protein n=1 Tax=Paenibacillus nuruki TaxID=1886670 RepID=UPI001112EF92